MTTRAAKPFPMTDPLLYALKNLRLAQQHLDEARREQNRRRDAALDWMRQEPKRTLGEAWAYVGAESAADEVKEARRNVTEAVRALLHLRADLDATTVTP